VITSSCTENETDMNVPSNNTSPTIEHPQGKFTIKYILILTPNIIIIALLCYFLFR